MSADQKPPLNPNVQILLDEVKKLREEIAASKPKETIHSHEKEPEPPKVASDVVPDLAAALRHADSCPDCGKVADEYVRKKIKENFGLEPDVECAGCGEKVFKTQPKCLKCGGTKLK